MHRSKWFSIFALVTLFAMVLGACSPAATATTAPTTVPATTAPGATEAATAVPAASATAATIGSANTLVIDSNLTDLITLDPAVAYEFSGVLIVHNVYETLVKFEGSDLSNLKPALADKWDVKESGDNWDITFTLHDGVKFASGNPLTADDVVYSFQRVVGLNKSPAFLFTDIAKLTADSFKATDAKTVVITMPKTASPGAFLSILTFTIGGIVDSKEVKTHEVSGDFGSAWLLNHSAGSGPFAVDHWTQDVDVLLTANANFGGAKPALAGVLLKYVADSANQQAELEKGDADVAKDLNAEQIAAIKTKSGLVDASGDSLQLFYVGLNVAFKPLDDVKVREAMRMAVDYDGIIAGLLSGNAKKVQTIIPAGLLGYNADAPFQQDVAGALALMKDAGQESGFTIDMQVPAGVQGAIAWADLAAKLQSDWAKINITVNIQQITFAELLANYRAQKSPVTLVLWGPDFPDPDANVGPFSDIGAKSIAFRNSWSDTIADKAHAAALITDPTARVVAYKEITDYILHNGPYIVLYQPTQLFGLSDKVKGFAWNPMGYADFWTISK